ncbi:c-type cytochrome [Sulfurospirillum sp. 1612]|uniref:c-type cytochrome n=1 Tax=Sulfurospirillum sp. 1612 TaxID=3094835 RepID=UPI002F9230EE
MKLHIMMVLIVSVFYSSLYSKDVQSTIPSVIYKGCAGCHGVDGKNKAFGRSEIIAGQDVEDLIDSIDFFKNSQLSSRSVTTVMGKQVKHLNQKQIRDLAIYISNLGGK